MHRTLNRSLWRFAAALILVGVTATASAQEPGPPPMYPADSAYTPVQCSDPTLVNGFDSCDDSARDHRNVVGGGSMPAYQIANNGIYLFMRLRLEGDPRFQTELQPFAWGFGIDINQNGRFEAYVSAVGTTPDRVEVRDQDPANGTTPDRVRVTPADDTSLTPAVTDNSVASWVQVTSAGSRFCPDSSPGSDYFLTVAVPLFTLNQFGALGGSIAYGGSSSNLTGIQTDFVCMDGNPTCTTGADCASGICLQPAGFCGPVVEPIALGCLDTSVDNSATDAGCNTTNRHCLVANNTSVCVPCITAAQCVDSDQCTLDTCTSNVCGHSPAPVGTACSLGICDSTQVCSVVAVSISSPADGSTVTTATPVVTGTATRGVTLEIAVDGTVVGTTTADNSGNWSRALTAALGEGSRTVTATVITGNSGVMDASTFTVDTLTSVAITSPVLGSVVAGTVSAISGTGEPDAIVTVTLDSVVLGDVTVDSTGAWSRSLTASLGVGTYTVSVSARDLEGNSATDGGTFSVVACLTNTQCSSPTPLCNTTSNTCVACLSGADCNDSNECTTDVCTTGACGTVALATGTGCSVGVCDVNRVCAVPTVSIVSPQDASVTADATPSILGTATPGIRVALELDGLSIGSATADSTGSWTLLVTSPLGAGSHTLIARVTTANGNATDSVTFAVDTGTVADAGTGSDASVDLDAGVDPDAGADASVDSGLIADAGTDASVSADAAVDASAMADAGTDAAVIVDAGANTDASLDLDSGALADASTDGDAGTDADAGVPGDSGTDASFGDGAVGNDDAGPRTGRYSGGCTCSATGTTSNNPFALGMFTLGILVLLSRIGRRRRS